MRHVISALVMNEPGVLANVAGMFAARGFNIDSLVVGRTENPDLSRMTIVVTADDNTLAQVRKQLAKLVPVVNVHDFCGSAYIERDCALVTINVTADKRAEVVDIANLFRGKVVDVAPESVMVELAGRREGRGVHRARPPVRHQGTGPHRRDRDGPRNAVGEGDRRLERSGPARPDVERAGAGRATTELGISDRAV
jgi:acetolactate synthase-1/3 small subunit